MTGIELRDGRVAAVVTDRGRIECDVVVNAAGMYAPEVGRMVGVSISDHPVRASVRRHRAVRPALPALPTLRDPDNLIYFRTEVGGLVMGGYERKPAAWALDGIPAGFEAQLLAEDWDRMEELMTNAIRRVPALETLPIKRFFNGPEAFTPDAEFILGESEVPGFWVAAGFCAHGLAGAGGIGKTMAEWIVDGQPEWEVWALDIRRFGATYGSQRFTLARTYEALSRYYDIKYPGEEKRAARPLRVSPAYPRHVALGAVFGEKSGWERVNWYASNAAAGDEALRPRGWAGENWSPAIAAEAAATRTSPACSTNRASRSSRCSGRARSTCCSGCARTTSRARRPRHLHAAAEPARRHRVRPVRGPHRRGSLPARHRHRLRHPRPALDRAPRAPRRIRPRQRRDREPRLLRAVGPERARRSCSR